MTVGLGFEAIAATWANQLDPSIALGATAAGWRVVFDLEYADAGTWEALHRYALVPGAGQDRRRNRPARSRRRHGGRVSPRRLASR